MSTDNPHTSTPDRPESAATSPEAGGEQRRLRAVPDLPDSGDSADLPDSGGEAGRDGAGYTYEPPDVIGLDRKRAEYEAAMPGISEEMLEQFLKIYSSHLAPATVAAYESVLIHLYKHAEKVGFHPLTCLAANYEVYFLYLVVSGKIGPNGERDPDDPYSGSYFNHLKAAVKAASAAAGVKTNIDDVDIKRVLSGYKREYGSKLAENARSPIQYDQIVDIERRVREGSTRRAAMPRAAIALGCDPDLRLSVSELCGLTFADIEMCDDHARITTRYRNTAAETVVAARPGDPACPVAALKDLRSAAHRKMRADHGGKAPTESEIGSASVFANAQTGDPLSRPGLRKVVANACAALTGVPDPETGMLPALTLSQRREAMRPTTAAKTTRDLALVSHTAFTTGRVSEMARFRVCDIEILGRDSDGANATVPLVNQTEADGTTTTGIIDRIAEVTETDLLDHDGNSLYESGLIKGVHNIYAFGTKSKDSHDNRHRAQAGHPACPVRLLVMWLKEYDRIMVARHGRRLAPEDPLYTRIKIPGKPISSMSHTLSTILKDWVVELGIDPKKYSGHSLRKTRDTYILSKGGDLVEAMVHAGRTSVVSGPAYARRDPRNPLAGDPTANLYDEIAAANSQNQADNKTAAGTSAVPAAEPGSPQTPEPPNGQQPEKTEQAADDSADATGDKIAALQSAVAALRASGLNEKAIAALAELEDDPPEDPAPETAKRTTTRLRPLNPVPAGGPEAKRPHRKTQRRRR